MGSDIHALQVHIGNQTAGVLRVRGLSARFRFYESFIEDPARLVLGLRFEEDVRRDATGHGQLPSWFANLLPEGRLNEIVRASLHNPIAPQIEGFDVLARLGSDLPGAVRIVEVEDLGDESFEEIEASIGEDREFDYEGLANVFRFSLAGVGMKFSMLRTGDRFAAPARGVLGDWLVKLPDPVFPDLPVNEFATMSLAASCGIEVPEIRLVNRTEISSAPDYVWGAEEDAYAIRRFDRSSEGRIHIEDLAQVRGYYPKDKYRGAFETAANLVWRGHDDSALEQFVRRLVFGILLGNSDAHLKNWSLIYRDGRRPTLSPAYDIVSVCAYPGVAHDLGLRLNGSRGYDAVRLSDFDRLAQKLGFRGSKLSEIAREVVANVDRSWPIAEEVLERKQWLIPPIRSHISRMRSQLLGS